MSGQKGWPAPANFMLILTICGILSACSPVSGEIKRDSTPDAALPEIGSCSLDLPETVTDKEAIVALLSAEGAYVVQQDIVALMRLWVPDGRVSDAKHTPTNLADDQTWQGTDAIRHRYVHWVFPGAPKVAQAADLIISITGKKAVVTGTTRIGDEVSPAGDHWQLVKVGNCWLIRELIFNLEPPLKNSSIPSPVAHRQSGDEAGRCSLLGTRRLPLHLLSCLTVRCWP